MISCIVIEKDVSSFNTLTTHIHLMNDMQLKGWFNNLEEGLAFCAQEKVDLCMIDMEGLMSDGIEPVKAFVSVSAVILTSGSSEYALQAFEAGVVDYMLKPITFARLFFALEKVRRIYYATSHSLPMPAGLSAGEHLFIKSGNKVVRMKIQDILYVEGLKSYVAFHSKKEKVLSLMTMKDAETRLKPFSFIRIHKSYIINLNHVNYIEKGMVLLNDAGALPIGETYKAIINEKFRI